MDEKRSERVHVALTPIERRLIRSAATKTRRPEGPYMVQAALEQARRDLGEGAK